MHVDQNLITIGEYANQLNDGKFDMAPDYQRKPGRWSKDKKSKFIGALLNGYPTTSLFFEDYPFHSAKVHTAGIADGLQRTTALLEFLKGEVAVKSGQDSITFGDLDDTQRDAFLAIKLPYTMIYGATAEEMNEIFFNLQQAEKLTTGENLNGIGGALRDECRSIIQSPFFVEKVSASNVGYRHLEMANKLVFIESRTSDWLTGGSTLAWPDLRAKSLYTLAQNSYASSAAARTLRQEAEKNLAWLYDCFDVEVDSTGAPILLKDGSVKGSRYLAGATILQFWYLWAKQIRANYSLPGKGDTALKAAIKAFIVDFHTSIALLRDKKSQAAVNPLVAEYEAASKDGVNTGSKMAARAQILDQMFLQANPGLVMRNHSRRHFTAAERETIHAREGGVCSNPDGRDDCLGVVTLADMDADHIISYVAGGETTLENARCLCRRCNRGRSL